MPCLDLHLSIRSGKDVLFNFLTLFCYSRFKRCSTEFADEVFKRHGDNLTVIDWQLACRPPTLLLNITSPVDQKGSSFEP